MTIFRGVRGKWLALFVLVGVVSMGMSWLTPEHARGDDPPPAKVEEAAPAKNPPPSAPPKATTGAGRMGQNFLPDPEGAPFARFQGLIGYFLLIGIAYLVSRKRKEVLWRPVIFGLVLQACFALIVLNPVVGRFFFDVVDKGVRRLLSFAEAGIDFVMQSTVPHNVEFINATGQMTTEMFIGRTSPVLKNFAFWILPTVIFFSSLITLLYHLGIMQIIVNGISRAMVYAMRTSGSETLSCTANVFVGQTEAPLLVKPFIGRMTQSELMAVMTGGFATVAGGVLAIYVSMLKGIPGIAGHLVTASIMAAPCALAIAKLMYPETEESATAGALKLEIERPDSNVIEAAARGATEGMGLVLNITAVLIGFVGLVTLFNAIIGLAGLSLEGILAWILRPLAWSMGVPWSEASLVGQLLGEKLVLTELIAYLHLKSVLQGTAGTAMLSRRSAVIASYSLCGFANVASIGIQIGGIGGMAPERRGDLARLGLFAMFAGAIVSCLSGTIAGFFV